jgi:hypothetical protein
MAAAHPWAWDIELDGLAERYVTLETHDGIHREGKITGVVTKKLTILDAGKAVHVELPVHIELNGDPSDILEFSRISRFELR